jgi:hypothetical protein
VQQILGHRLKQQVLAECERPGASVAAVALSHGTKEFQTVSESLWEVRLTHGWLIDAVLDGLELASARLSCRDSAGPVGSIGARCV